jgi:hypothetical protein
MRDGAHIWTETELADDLDPVLDDAIEHGVAYLQPDHGAMLAVVRFDIWRRLEVRLETTRLFLAAGKITRGDDDLGLLSPTRDWPAERREQFAIDLDAVCTHVIVDDGDERSVERLLAANGLDTPYPPRSDEYGTDDNTEPETEDSTNDTPPLSPS